MSGFKFKYVFVPMLTLAMTVMFSSCGKKKVEVPANIISIEKMSEMLTDVQIAEAGFVVKHYQDADKKYNTSKYYLFILNKYGVSENEFEESFEFYSKHPFIFDIVFQNVLNNLSRKQAEIAGK